MNKKIILGLFVCFFMISFLAIGEDITITTYYPAPYGVYKNLKWGSIATNDSRGLLTDDQGASIELGGKGRPYIDFSNDMSSSNYDFRIMLKSDRDLGMYSNVDTTLGGVTYYDKANQPAKIRVSEVWFCKAYNDL